MITLEHLSGAVRAFNRAANDRLLAWRLKDSDAIECLRAALEEPVSTIEERDIAGLCYDDPARMLRKQQGPLWASIQGAQKSLEAISQHVARCGDQVDALQMENLRLKREIKYLRHYGNKSCTAQADKANAEGTME